MTLRTNMPEDALDNPYICGDGRRLYIGCWVEVDTNAPDGAQDFGQLIAGPDKNGIWEYRYLSMTSVNTGSEETARAAHYDMGRYHPEPKQTEAARATRRKLRALGFRISHFWDDGLVQMSRPNGITVTTRLDGSIRVSSREVFEATAEMIGEGMIIASSKGMV